MGCGETLRDQIFQALFLYSVPNKVELEHYMVVLKENEDHFFKHQADMLLHGIKVVSYGDCFDNFPGYVQDLATQICRQRSPGRGFPSWLLQVQGRESSFRFSFCFEIQFTHHKMQQRHDSCTTKFPGPPVTLKKASVSNRRSGSRRDGDICARDVSVSSCADSSLRLFLCRRTPHAPGHLSQEKAPASSCGGGGGRGSWEGAEPSRALIPLLRFPSSGCRGTECFHLNGVPLCPCGPHTFSSDSPGPALGEPPGMTKMTEQILIGRPDLGQLTVLSLGH